MNDDTRETGEKGDRIREILDLALERPAPEREAYVAGLCADDAGLHAEAASLLRALERGGTLLEPPEVPPTVVATPLTGLVFGHYRVGERLGEGGMGVVYQAQDTRLGRTVAVKALPSHLAADPHRRARLEHEARVLASLSHANIATIFGIEETERGPVLVLEHVGGETLAQRLSHGPLPIEEARAVARQVLLALEGAHAAGIVHRDIKPSNIKLPPDGPVKVLDFGIARAAPPPGVPGGVTPASGSPAPPHPPQPPHGPMTAPGAAIGTPEYMSPEQARGRPVDRRTDLWSWGCVVYEMLTARRAFAGQTASDTMAAVLRSEPDWSALPIETPAPIARLLRRCLEKDPARRQRDAGDALLDLDEPVAAVPGPGVRRRTRGTLAIGAVVFLAGAVVSGVILEARRSRPSGSAVSGSTRFAIEVPKATPLWMTPDGAVAVSPDGRTIVYSAGSTETGPRLFARPLDGLKAEPIAGAERGVTPFFSPDGKWIGFQDDGRRSINRVLATGGAAQAIVTATGSLQGVSWGDDGTIVFAVWGTSGLRRVPASGGTVTELTQQDLSLRELGHIQPEFLPGAAVVLFSCGQEGRDGFESSIDAVWVADGARRRLVQSASQPRFVPPETLLFVQSGSLMAAPFDAVGVRITGEAREVLRGLAGDEAVPFRRYDASRDGRTIALLPGKTTYMHTRLARFGFDGTCTTVFGGRGTVDGPRFSPDGTRVALVMGWTAANVWVHDLERGSTTPITTSGVVDYPIWSADGRRIAYRHMPAGEPARIEWVPADGSAPPEPLWTFDPGSTGYPTSFTPDGGTLAITLVVARDHLEDLALLPLSGGPPRPILSPPARRLGARFSPDGKLVVYTSVESGRFEVCVQPYPALDRRIQVSVDGGYRPAWSGDGRQILFRLLDRVYSADVVSEPELTVSRPRLMLEHLPDAKFDAAPDGKSVVMGCPTGEWGPQFEIDVMVDWQMK